MDGGLTASLINGTLFINEAPGSLGLDQGVQVAQLPTGHVRVTGLEAPGGGATLINGATTRIFNHPTNIVMGLGSGQDLVQVLNTRVKNIQILAESPSGSPNDNDFVNLTGVRTTGVVDIRMGAGVDTVTVLNSTIGDGVGLDDLKITTGVPTAIGLADSDTVLLQGVATKSATIITTGASNDHVFIRDSKLGNDINDFLSIRTGAGADNVEIGPPVGQLGNFQQVGGNIVIQTFDSAAEADDDKVRLQQLTFESALVQLGEGNDELTMLGDTATKTIQLEGMGGNDKMNLTEVEALDSFFALMGQGNDVLNTTFIKARRAMTLDGGPGFDSLTRSQTVFVPNLKIQNWEVINGKLVLSVNPLDVGLTPSKA